MKSARKGSLPNTQSLTSVSSILTLLDRYTDAVHSKHCDLFFVYDDSARKITTVEPKTYKTKDVLENVLGSARSAKTLRLNLAQTKIFMNHNDRKIVFGDITKEGNIVNLSYLDRGVGGAIADY
jgi:hypothetical protein